jgi:uncharacterized protein
MDKLVKDTHEYVKEYMSHYDASHDFDHILRVLHLAQDIEAQERRVRPQVQFDSNITTLAALLHDVGDKKYLPPGQDGTTLVKTWLIEHGADEELAMRVQLICTNVSYTNETANFNTVQKLCKETPELAIVQDADRLDAIGAVGIARLFAYTGAKVQERGLEVGHFHVKLLKIKERMKTFLTWWHEETKGLQAMKERIVD